MNNATIIFQATNLAVHVLGWQGVAPTSIPLRNAIKGVDRGTERQGQTDKDRNRGAGTGTEGQGRGLCANIHSI